MEETKGEGSLEQVSIPESLLLYSPKVEIALAGDKVAGAVAWAEKVVEGVSVAKIATMSTVIGADKEALDKVSAVFHSVATESCTDCIRKANSRLERLFDGLSSLLVSSMRLLFASFFDLDLDFYGKA